MTFSEVELYAIKCAIEGKHEQWKPLPFNGVLRYQLENIAARGREGLQIGSLALHLLFDPTTVETINRIDTSKPVDAPRPTASETAQVFVPPLPKEAQLSRKAEKSAETCGHFIDELVSWVSGISPMTPRHFIMSGAHFAVSLAVARRACLPFYKPIYPQFYVLWVAPTSRYKKSTGSQPINSLIRAAIPHMLLPEEMTPEAMIMALAGKRPVNYDKLSGQDKELIDRGIPHAARRGIYIDEVSSLFGAMKHKDHMQGFEELLLKGADSPALHRRWTISEGFFALRNLNLNLLGLTTPAALARNLRAEDWETGLFARFLIFYPLDGAIYQLPNVTPDQLRPPGNLITALRAIDKALPEPPSEAALQTGDAPEFKVINVMADPEVLAGFEAYTRALTFDMLAGRDAPDERLHGGYSRLHEYAAKFALTTAISDWVMDGAREEPRVRLSHWARGHQAAEVARQSIHHLLVRLEVTDDDRNAAKIIATLGRYPQGMTRRDILRNTHLTSKAVDSILDLLLESGEIIQFTPEGRRAVLYKTVGGV